MAPFNLSQLESTLIPEPEAQAPAHAKDASTVEAPAKAATTHFLKAWADTLQLLEGCVMVAPDHKPELLEDQEMWMCEWNSVKVSMLSPIGMHMHDCVPLYLCNIFQMNLEACTACASEVVFESLNMSTECVELLKRGHKEYKALEVIVKGWKAKAVETVSGLPPKCTMHASEAHTTDALSCMV